MRAGADAGGRKDFGPDVFRQLIRRQCNYPFFQGTVGNFVADAVGGNPFSGLIDVTQSAMDGSAGANSFMYNGTQRAVAGAAQGFGGAATLVGREAPQGLADLAETAALARTTGQIAASGALGVFAVLKLGYDGATTFYAAVKCGNK